MPPCLRPLQCYTSPMDTPVLPSGRSPDFGRTAAYFARFRPPMPEEFFAELARRGVGLPGQRLVDLGCGTGLAARRFAQGGSLVTGVDPSAELIAEARRLDAEAQVSIEYQVAAAEDTGLRDASFDVLTAFTSWHYFDHDRALAEARRILKPRGRLAAAWYYWIVTAGSVVQATERLILKHNPAWKYSDLRGLPASHVERFSARGLTGIETFSLDRDVHFTHEEWRLRMMSCGGIGACLDEDAIREFDAEHAALLRDNFPPDLTILHRSFAITGEIAE